LVPPQFAFHSPHPATDSKLKVEASDVQIDAWKILAALEVRQECLYLEFGIPERQAHLRLWYQISPHPPFQFNKCLVANVHPCTSLQEAPLSEWRPFLSSNLMSVQQEPNRGGCSHTSLHLLFGYGGSADAFST